MPPERVMLRAKMTQLMRPHMQISIRTYLWRHRENTAFEWLSLRFLYINNDKHVIKIGF